MEVRKEGEEGKREGGKRDGGDGRDREEGKEGRVRAERRKRLLPLTNEARSCLPHPHTKQQQTVHTIPQTQTPNDIHEHQFSELVNSCGVASHSLEATRCPSFLTNLS